MTTFICPPQELPVKKVREIVRDAGCYWPEDDSFSSRMWRFDVRRIVNEAWRRGYADHAAAQCAAEDAKRLQSACCGNGHFDGPATPTSEGEQQ